jgi:YgiT-type zinc finger domain-containing protein
MVANRNKTGASSIKELMRNRCTECGGSPKKSVITQEFENEGVVIRISGVHAWVCAKCGQIYFEPGGAQRMAEAVRSLFALARSEKQHKGTVVADLS